MHHLTDEPTVTQLNGTKAELIERYQGYVRAIAANLRRGSARRIDFEELVEYGMVGLLEAAERFDPNNGACFSTFAYYRIRGSIIDGVRRMGWLSRAGYRLERQRSEQNDRAVHAERQAKLMGLASQETLERIAPQDDPPVDHVLAQHQEQAAIRRALARLSSSERNILHLYYFENQTLMEIGTSLGLSKSWTCRLHARALEKLGRLVTQLQLC